MIVLTRSLAVVAGFVLAAPALAQVPHNWQLGFQPAHSPTQAGIEGLHAMVLWLMTFVTIFVAALLEIGRAHV